MEKFQVKVRCKTACFCTKYILFYLVKKYVKNASKWIKFLSSFPKMYRSDMKMIFIRMEHLWRRSVKTLERLFERNFWTKRFLYCWATFWQHCFVAATNSNKKQQVWKIWGLLLLVVATKKITNFSLSSCWRAPENFWRARAIKHQKNCLNIK